MSDYSSLWQPQLFKILFMMEVRNALYVVHGKLVTVTLWPYFFLFFLMSIPECFDSVNYVFA